MNEEELRLLEQSVEGENFGTQETNPQRLQELTPEIQNQNAVVNRARPQNRMTGVSNFLANPEVQNALLQFGRAFTGNDPNAAGTILADAGEANLQSRGNQRALEAFESGEDIATAAGRFADPDTVAGLQARRQQENQFDEQMSLEAESLGLQREELESNVTYRTAKLALDEELAEATIANNAAMRENEEKLNDGRIAFWEAQAAALGQKGEGAGENFALRTQEFLATLEEQEQLIANEITNIADAFRDIDVDISQSQLRQLQSGDISVADIDFSDADLSYIPGLAESPWTPRLEDVVGPLQKELRRNVSRAQAVRGEKMTLLNIQARRLGGQGRITEDGSGSPEGGGEGGADAPGSSAENPIQINTVQGLEDVPIGTHVNYLGTQGVWNGETIR